MTTIDAAAADRPVRALAWAALTALIAGGLSGCGTSSNILGDNSAPAQTSVVQAPPAAVSKPQPQKRVTLAPVIGAPDGVAKQLATQLTDAMGKQKVAVAQAGQSSDYTVRGYIVAAPEKTGTKVSYIWDLTDSTGKRVNRVTGEEVVSGAPNAKDPWSAVSPQLMQTIADRTATQLAGAIPADTAVAQVASAPPSGAGGPVAGAATQPAVAKADTPQSAPAAQTLAGKQQQVASAQPAGSGSGSGSGSSSGELRAMMPMVNGAPGDGGQSLPGALQRELSKSGVNVSDRPAPNAFRIEGRVALGQDREGRQPIQIDWTVKDAQGNRVGTVSQKNEIEAGSLNGQWGQTAEMAAAAAAQGIIKLMQPPQKTATN